MKPKNVVLDCHGRIVMELPTLGACLAVASTLDGAGLYAPYSAATLEPVHEKAAA